MIQNLKNVFIHPLEGGGGDGGKKEKEELNAENSRAEGCGRGLLLAGRSFRLGRAQVPGLPLVRLITYIISDLFQHLS